MKKTAVGCSVCDDPRNLKNHARLMMIEMILSVASLSGCRFRLYSRSELKAMSFEELSIVYRVWFPEYL